MANWEYCLLEFVLNGTTAYLTDGENVVGFDHMGKKRWELVTMQQTDERIVAVFKRQALGAMVPPVFVGSRDEADETNKMFKADG